MKAGIPQGSALCPLIFLISIKDLANSLIWNAKLFADDTSLFSVVHNTTESTNLLNIDFSKINNWAIQCKMSFNSDLTNQRSYSVAKPHRQVTRTSCLIITAFRYDNWFEVKLWRTLKVSAKKISETVVLLRKFQGILSRASLITIYKSFSRPHLDYGDRHYAICDQTFNQSFHHRIQSIQYNAAIAITGAIRGTSSEKLYERLGLESLGSRRWLSKLCLFYKIDKNKSPSYFYKLIRDRVKFYSTRSNQINNVLNINTRSNFFRNSFFPFYNNWME